MSNGYRSTDDLLADSVDAERSMSFEGGDWGELIAAGHMDIEDAYELTAREQEEEVAEAEKWLIENRKTPEQKAEDQRQRTLEQNRYNYIMLGYENVEGYTPSPEDRIEREEELRSIREAVQIDW